MNQPIKEKLPGNPRFLVAPLDWGLGHTTRCIPIIRELVEQGCIVTLAGNGKQAELLLQEFPDLAMLPLQGYDIKYAKSSFGLIKNIIFQTPKLLRSIRNEHLWLQRIVEEYGFDAVISDNRYGLYHKKIPSIFITHQLTIKSPFGKWTEKMLQRRNYKYINRFTECWVPDYESENNLAGDLSHPTLKPTTPLKYIGALTRIKDKAVVKKEKHLAVILSGPEPQRSILEEKLINEISHYNGTATFIRGLPGN
ncbi:MAG TPA: glycosyl transferase family 28, partial [Chitinophagaceae bacterium]|nr:glycosyl transferase family 28 [Chitinophagaceae bacterium]HQX98092.1 glycosyl transferase family 28 [Chitinophagaceae bacterium]HRA12766.1 glycosyl transferase family 28 [Chitinophagaceae bacterium]